MFASWLISTSKMLTWFIESESLLSLSLSLSLTGMDSLMWNFTWSRHVQVFTVNSIFLCASIYPLPSKSIVKFYTWPGHIKFLHKRIHSHILHTHAHAHICVFELAYFEYKTAYNQMLLETTFLKKAIICPE